MLESTKEGLTGLPEGSDIGLGARCRVFESPHSDQIERPPFGAVFCGIKQTVEHALRPSGA